MSAFVPFFASQQQPPSESPEPNNKNDESKSGGLWGVGDWFRRDTAEKNKKDQMISKKQNIKIPKNNRKPEAAELSPAPLSKLQGLFSFNTTKSPEDKEKERNRNNNNSTNTNPLSVFQKFFAASFLKTMKPEEKWYTVFPKTRIMPGEMVPVSVAGIDLLVIASIDGRSLYCIANSCPHLGTPLETGRLTRLPIETKSVSTTSKTVVLPSSSSSSSSSSEPILATSTTSDADVAVLGSSNDSSNNILFSETDIANILSQDGCEDCIVCPLHRTAFALSSGEVRGEWCPYPPIIGPLMGTVKEPTSAAIFQVRTRGKNIEVCLNSLLRDTS
jgi:nitrite reductase/ring-hydroxylating ferredoxin subunit